jgi:hypothetical protein
MGAAAAAAAAAAGAARERETRAPTVVSILSRDVDSLVRSSSSGVFWGEGREYTSSHAGPRYTGTHTH